jgi:hypothetical protein
MAVPCNQDSHPIDPPSTCGNLESVSLSTRAEGRGRWTHWPAPSFHMSSINIDSLQVRASRGLVGGATASDRVDVLHVACGAQGVG